MNGFRITTGLTTSLQQYLIIFFGVLLLMGCTGLGSGRRLDKFNEAAESYKQVLEMSKFRKALTFIDQSKNSVPANIQSYANIKIVRYDVTRIQVSKDGRSVEQDVELKYFLRDRNILKTSNDHQVWGYKDEEKVWMLQTGLPLFVH